MKQLSVPVILAVLAFTQVPALHAQVQVQGPVLRIRTDPFDYDSARCGVTKCRNLYIRNEGDTALVFRQSDAIKAPFAGAIGAPFTLQPNEQKVVRLCYTPSGTAADSQRVHFRADNRVPLSIAMLFDVSASMNLPMTDGKTRIAATKTAGVDFIGHLLNTAEIQDEGAVFTYDDTPHFKIAYPFSSDRLQLSNAIPSAANGTITCTFMALQSTINQLAYRTKKRVLIILTDGDDTGPSCGPATVDTVINAAVAAQIQVYAISIENSAQASLSIIAAATGGEYFSARSSLDLIAIYRQIVTKVSQDIAGSFLIEGHGVSPVLEIEPAAFKFDTLRVGETSCRPITIRNTGSAWLAMDSVRRGFLLPYELRGISADSIAPGASVTGELCFSPMVAQNYTGTFTFRASLCSDTKLFLPVTAVAVPRGQFVPKTPLLRVEVIGMGGDTTFCQTTECRSIRFVNEGDTALTVHTVSPILPPFYGTVPVPFTLATQEARVFQVCYRPETAPVRDSQRVDVTADLRTDQYIGLVMDASGAMNTAWSGGGTRLDAMRTAAIESVNLLYARTDINDAAVEFAYSAPAAFRTVIGPERDKFLLRDSLPRFASGAQECGMDALVRAMNVMRGDARRKVLFLYTAGESGGPACGAATSTDVITQAVTEGFRVFVVDLGRGDSTAWIAIARQTGGGYARPLSSNVLIDTVRRFHARLAERASLYAWLQGRGVTPVARIAPDTLDFGTRATGDSTCIDFTLRNEGEAPLGFIGVSGPQLPYQLSGDAAAEILPGVTRTYTVCFAPKASGLFIDSIVIATTSCVHGPRVVHLRGQALASDTSSGETSVAEGVWRTRRTLLTSNALYFDDVPCGTTVCLNTSIRNTGDTTAVIHSMTTPAPPFTYSGAQPPIRIAPGDSTVLRICYTATSLEPGWNIAAPLLIMQDRVETGAAVVIDTRRENEDVIFLPGLRMRRAITSAAAEYFRHMSITGVRDLVALYGTGTPIRQYKNFTLDSSALISALPARMTDSSTCMKAAIERAMRDMKTGATTREAVVLLLGKEDTCTSVSDTALIAEAQRRSIRVFAVLLGGTPSAALRTLCDSTGGSAAGAATYQDVIRALSAVAMTLGDRIANSIFLRGTPVLPSLAFSPEWEVAFGTIPFGRTSCTTVRVRNGGPAALSGVLLHIPFGGGTLGPLNTIPAGSDTAITVCVTPARIGRDTADIVATYAACGDREARIPVTIRSVDSVSCFVGGEYRGKPGSIVRIPVRFSGALHPGGDMKRLWIRLGADRSMLAPEPPYLITDGALAGAWALSNLNVSVNHSSDRTFAQYLFSGSVSPEYAGGDTLFGTALFRVLLGSALRTDITLEQLETGLDRVVVGTFSNAHFTVDSLCYIGLRLVTSHGVNRLVGSSPNPFNPTTTLSYELGDAVRVRITVHDAFGRLAATLIDADATAGRHDTVFDASALPAGVYLVRMDAAGTTSVLRVVCVK